jgi:hypothetical protein
MDAPPPISPLTAEDEKLLKRARNAGRNLSILALLATFGAIALTAAAFLAKGAHGVMAILAGTIALIAAGYWVLAVAGRRGNPNSVGIVIVAMVLQICLAVIMSGVAAARTNTPFQPPTSGIVIPILILLALANSRTVLVELQRRQLWHQVFGSAKPSRNLCFLGGILLVSGFVAMNLGAAYAGRKAGQEQKAEFQNAKEFIALIQNDEKEFVASMRGIAVNPGADAIANALEKLASLQRNFEAIKNHAAGEERLLEILNTYGNALRQWKNGLMLLQETNPDRERAQQMLKLGDKLRREAGEDFDRRYSGKKP